MIYRRQCERAGSLQRRFRLCQYYAESQFRLSITNYSSKLRKERGDLNAKEGELYEPVGQ